MSKAEPVVQEETGLRAELARVTAERDALLAERERAAPLVAAARAYAEAFANARVAFAVCERSIAPTHDLVRSAGVSLNEERVALEALVAAARELPADGGTR